MAVIPTTPFITNETASGNAFKLYSAYYLNDAVIVRNLKTGYKEFHPGINKQQYGNLLLGLQWSLLAHADEKTRQELAQLLQTMDAAQKETFTIGLNFLDNEQNNPQKPTFVVSQIL